MLIPEPLPSRGHSKPLIRFLVGVVVLHFFLSVAGFIYLYNEKMVRKKPYFRSLFLLMFGGTAEWDIDVKVQHVNKIKLN